jgi:hypothetical protein
MIYKHTYFDDFVIDEYGIWSQICSKCVEKHFKNHRVADIAMGGLICGVENCENEADFYIDFICEKIGQEKN